jgi:hypothetical protein
VVRSRVCPEVDFVRHQRRPFEVHPCLKLSPLIIYKAASLVKGTLLPSLFSEMAESERKFSTPPPPDLTPKAQTKSQSTPLKSDSHIHSLHNRNYRETRQDNYDRMDRCLIGPQSPDKFMDAFMPNTQLPEDFEQKDGSTFLNFKTAFETEKEYAKAVVNRERVCQGRRK